MASTATPGAIKKINRNGKVLYQTSDGQLWSSEGNAKQAIENGKKAGLTSASSKSTSTSKLGSQSKEISQVQNMPSVVSAPYQVQSAIQQALPTTAPSLSQNYAVETALGKADTTGTGAKFTESEATKAQREAAEKGSINVLGQIGQTSPEREAAYKAYKEALYKQNYQPGQTKLEQSLMARGLGGSSAYARSIADYMSGADTQLMLAGEQLRTQDEATKLNELSALQGVQGNIYNQTTGLLGMGQQGQQYAGTQAQNYTQYLGDLGLNYANLQQQANMENARLQQQADLENQRLQAQKSYQDAQLKLEQQKMYGGLSQSEYKKRVSELDKQQKLEADRQYNLQKQQLSAQSKYLSSQSLASQPWSSSSAFPISSGGGFGGTANAPVQSSTSNLASAISSLGSPSKYSSPSSSSYSPSTSSYSPPKPYTVSASGTTKAGSGASGSVSFSSSKPKSSSLKA